MKKAAIAFLIFVMVSAFAFADEGMWIISGLKKSNWDRMRELGFKIPENLLYSTNHASIKDAVVQFGGGCTGVTVSEKGLIFTNHHCGYASIQSQSSMQHNYLRDGFVARTMTDEIPIPGLTVKYLVRMEDVSSKIIPEISTLKNEDERAKAVSKIDKSILDTIPERGESYEAQIFPFYSNNAYYLVVYKVFRDVRMVFAPPSSMGKFGGDTDNWMWPRQTCDFSVFRVYAGKNNEPADYSKDNLPYQPKYYVPVSLEGYKEEDYAMTIGFPGRTSRYIPSWGIEQRMKSINEPRIYTRGIKQDIWEKAMNTSEDTRIKYSSKYAASSNYWKNSIGMNRAIVNMGVIEKKRQLEKQFTDWLDRNPDKKAFYGKILPSLKEAYTKSDEEMKDLTYLYESLMGGTEVTNLSLSIDGYLDSNKGKFSKDSLTEDFNHTLLPKYKDYLPSLDQKVLAAMLKVAREKISADHRPSVYQEIDKKFKGDDDKYAEYLFSKSLIPYADKLRETLTDPKKMNNVKKDPAYVFAQSVRECFSKITGGNLKEEKSNLSKAERLYLAGLMQMEPDKDFASDANFTMRLSYGKIGGYEPFDGAWYKYYTTTKGILEKYKKDDPEFNVEPEILSLLKSKDFGRYGNKNGDMNLCFLSNNDITGGNSGSPVFDRNGWLLGLAFDGNWEAMSGDIAFEPDVQRTISVDVRFILFLIDKWGHCERLINELKME